ncbi:MAG: M15 family metallopeptidase [Proteobacteria bacterium]|nr:M15 family metallopeptidase [Pseudomonadota bacterium]
MPRLKIYFLSILYFLANPCFSLPKDFSYLDEFTNKAIVDLRYLGSNNFVGDPIPGYYANRCILTTQAAKALAKVAEEAHKKGFILKVYDCYRPQKAVSAFYRWSKDSNNTQMQSIYYPREDKQNLFAKGYIAQFSGHSRGSTVDLSLVSLKTLSNKGHENKELPCFGKTGHYFQDNSIDTGTSFDCFDERAHIFSKNLSQEQKRNRLLLRNLMIKQGFRPYSKEWWHFTLRNEPYPHKIFDFPVK